MLPSTHQLSDAIKRLHTLTHAKVNGFKSTSPLVAGTGRRGLATAGLAVGSVMSTLLFPSSRVSNRLSVYKITVSRSDGRHIRCSIQLCPAQSRRRPRRQIVADLQQSGFGIFACCRKNGGTKGSRFWRWPLAFHNPGRGCEMIRRADVEARVQRPAALATDWIKQRAAQPMQARGCMWRYLSLDTCTCRHE